MIKLFNYLNSFNYFFPNKEYVSDPEEIQNRVDELKRILSVEKVTNGELNRSLEVLEKVELFSEKIDDENVRFSLLKEIEEIRELCWATLDKNPGREEQPKQAFNFVFACDLDNCSDHNGSIAHSLKIAIKNYTPVITTNAIVSGTSALSSLNLWVGLARKLPRLSDRKSPHIDQY